MDKIRLLIASEDPSIRRGLNIIFKSEQIFDVLGSFNVPDVVVKSVAEQPDVVLIDMSGDLSQYGTQVKQIKSQCPCSLILSLIPDGHKNGISDILEQGVDGCVPRSIMRVCLVKAVELTCRAGVFCLPGNCRDLVSNAGAIQPGSLDLCKLQLSGGTDSLTRREKEILQLMAKNLSNRDIAGKLFISEPTVKTHVSSILRKLGQKNRSQAIVYAYKTGMLNDPP